MKHTYISIMDSALAVYTAEDIHNYLSAVKRDGITEHGFPRLTANIGILLSHGKRPDLRDTFAEMMELCTRHIPNTKAAHDFSVREICCCLHALRDTALFGEEQISVWCERMRQLDPKQTYNEIAVSVHTRLSNWGAFNAASEIARNTFLAVDTTDFIETQLATQLAAVNAEGRYRDPGNPTVYDLVARLLFATVLRFGYNGTHKAALKDALARSADITAKLQSVTGEIPFGGRSNQMAFNEMLLAGLMEYYAACFAQSGDRARAETYKAGAVLAQSAVLRHFRNTTVSHVKNQYAPHTQIGCEDYAYFNKYMITVASFAYLAYLLCDDSITPSVSVTERGGYIAHTDRDFHTLILNAGGYFAEWDFEANFHYDANGLGRVHKHGHPSPLCLSVPFPAASEAGYLLDTPNPRPMSLCCYGETNGTVLYGAAPSARYTVLSAEATPTCATATVRCALSETVTPVIATTVSAGGVTLRLEHTDACDACGFMLPVFAFDGKTHTEIAETDTAVTVTYGGSRCTYTFNGTVQGYELYSNRNGTYRVYRVATDTVTITIE